MNEEKKPGKGKPVATPKPKQSPRGIIKMQNRRKEAIAKVRDKEEARVDSRGALWYNERMKLSHARVAAKRAEMEAQAQAAQKAASDQAVDVTPPQPAKKSFMSRVMARLKR